MPRAEIIKAFSLLSPTLLILERFLPIKYYASLVNFTRGQAVKTAGRRV
jgi:hypothetical protein